MSSYQFFNEIMIIVYFSRLVYSTSVACKSVEENSYHKNQLKIRNRFMTVMSRVWDQLGKSCKSHSIDVTFLLFFILCLVCLLFGWLNYPHSVSYACPVKSYVFFCCSILVRLKQNINLSFFSPKHPILSRGACQYLQLASLLM